MSLPANILVKMKYFLRKLNGRNSVKLKVVFLSIHDKIIEYFTKMIDYAYKIKTFSLYKNFFH